MQVCDFGLSRVRQSTWMSNKSQAGTPGEHAASEPPAWLMLKLDSDWLQAYLSFDGHTSTRLLGLAFNTQVMELQGLSALTFWSSELIARRVLILPVQSPACCLHC